MILIFSQYNVCFIKSYGWYETPDNLFNAMEYFELGDLQTYLSNSLPLPELEAKDVSSQILEGLSYMHENGFAHRDIKPCVCPPIHCSVGISNLVITMSRIYW